MSDTFTWAAGAALLDMGRRIDGLSRVLTAAGFALLLVDPAWRLPGWGLALVGLAGLAQGYFALRVAFDAALFRGLAGGRTVEELDEALLTLRLLPPGKAGRPAQARLAGARRLLLLQAVAFGVQVAAVLLAAAVGAR